MSAHRRLTDDLGAPVELPQGPVCRVVSLVPSLTEALHRTRPEGLVGATDWCTHPPDLDVTRVRGTKNPDRAAIQELAPELVVCVQEENRELDVTRLREAGVPVWVGVVESVDDALRVLRTLITQVLAWPEPDWLTEVDRLWAPDQQERPAGHVRARVTVPIWRDPWMVVGPQTYTTDLLARAGLGNVFADDPDTYGADPANPDTHDPAAPGAGTDPGERYPKVEVEQIDGAGADVVLLPDEPYVFTAQDGPEAFCRTRTQLVSGRLLTWYGPAMIEARRVLENIPAD